MRISVNGEPCDATPGATIAELIQTRGMAGRPIAVELNAAVVPRERHAETTLSEGDEIEIVAFVGGG